METLRQAAQATPTTIGGFTGTDVLGLLPDTLLDELTDAVDAFEPLTPLEMVLGDWEHVEIDPVLLHDASVPANAAIKQEPREMQLHQPQPAQPPQPQPRPPMKNPSRERLRAELKYLRQKVIEMERHLETVKTQQIQSRSIKWDQVAHDELRKRQRAEELNRQLGSALDKQTRAAQRLERLLQQNHGADAFARFCDMEKCTITPSTSINARWDDDAVMTRLEDEVVRAFATVDHVLAECKLDDAEVRYTTSHTDVKTLTASHEALDRRPQILMELLDSKLVPFDFGRTCDAFWRALSTADVYKLHDVDMLVATGNTIRFKSRLQWEFNGEQRHLRCILVMKRYTTADRMVVVWRGATTQSNDATARWIATGWEETGWIVVREMASHINDERPCVLQTITRLVPRWQAPSSSYEAAEIGAFATMVLAAAEDDVTNITSAMQSLLLAEVLENVAAHDP